jgi:hypothetical protein
LRDGRQLLIQVSRMTGGDSMTSDAYVVDVKTLKTRLVARDVTEAVWM